MDGRIPRNPRIHNMDGSTLRIPRIHNMDGSTPSSMDGSTPSMRVCVIWNRSTPISVIPRIVVTRIVVIPVFVVTIPGPVGGAAAQYRHYKKNYQDNQQGFSHCRPPWSAPKSGCNVLFASIINRWGGDSRAFAGSIRLPMEVWRSAPTVREGHSVFFVPKM